MLCWQSQGMRSIALAGVLLGRLHAASERASGKCQPATIEIGNDDTRITAAPGRHKGRASNASQPRTR